MKFSYKAKESRIIGSILLKPFIEIEIFSKNELWYGLDEVLVDTGADITLIPKYIGEEVVNEIKSGEKAFLKGISPIELAVYIHRLKLKVANREFETKVAIAESDEVPAILGRFEALDNFNAEFSKGKELSLE